MVRKPRKHNGFLLVFVCCCLLLFCCLLLVVCCCLLLLFVVVCCCMLVCLVVGCWLLFVGLVFVCYLLVRTGSATWAAALSFWRPSHRPGADGRHRDSSLCQAKAEGCSDR